MKTNKMDKSNFDEQLKQSKNEIEELRNRVDRLTHEKREGGLMKV